MINCQRKILTILKYSKHNTIWCLCRLRAVCQSSVTWLRRWSARPVGPPCWRLDSHRTITTWPTTAPTVQVWVSTISYVSCFLRHLVVNTVKNLLLQLTKEKTAEAVLFANSPPHFIQLIVEIENGFTVVLNFILINQSLTLDLWPL